MDETLKELASQEYKEGFVTDVEQEYIPKGLNENIIRMISEKKGEPDWLLQFRLDAFRKWQTMKEPDWGHLKLPKIDYQDIIYWAAPKKDSERPTEIDPALMETFDKLGIPLHEREVLAGVKAPGAGNADADTREGAAAGAVAQDGVMAGGESGQRSGAVAVDAVFDSVSVATTYRKTLADKGIIFCSFSEAVREHPDLVRKYLASVVPASDNFFAALNSAVFSDGSFCYIPKGVKCPMDLSSYFRINASGTGQFERTLIIADEGSSVSYMEGCTAPMRDEHQLHAAVVEIVVEKDADVRYSTVQNWYPGDAQGRGGILNLVTKRGLCKGMRAFLQSNPAYRWIAMVITLMGIIALVFGIGSIVRYGMNSFAPYVALFGFAAIFMFSGLSVLPTARNNKKAILSRADRALADMEDYLKDYPNFPTPARYAHPIVLQRMLRAVEEGRAQTCAQALDAVKEELKTLNRDVQVEQDEYDEVVAVKPLFLNENYR